MKNQFLYNILDMKKQQNLYMSKAYESIYENLFLKNKWGSDKLTDLDEYDSELKTIKQLFPGYIYMFKYKSESVSTYNINGVKLQFFDNFPIILCIKDYGNYIQGINLNLCNLSLKTLILNDIYNLDPNFFEKDAELQAANGNFPISKSIIQTIDKNPSKYYEYIKNTYKLENISVIIRNYSKSNITNIRFIEPWQWKYVPFLNYKTDIKEAILQAIQEVTNINKVCI